MSLKTDMQQFYHDTQMMLTVGQGKNMRIQQGLEPFGKLLSVVCDAKERINDPVCVAFAGYMKAGKSTLLNAFMKLKILYSGVLVTTYTPTWFKYAPSESIELVFKDGSRLKKPMEELKAWTTMAEVSADSKIRDVEYVIIYYPSETLKLMEFIDTPGLFSPVDDDSERSMRFLGITHEEAQSINDEQTAKADAIIYAFSGFFKENDLRAVGKFTSTPLNALGLFTKPDQSYWDAYEPDIDPLHKVQPVVERLSNELKDKLYCLLPVCALCVEGISDMDEELWQGFETLRQCGVKALCASLRSVDRFIKSDIDGVGIELRKRMAEKFGIYGIYRIVNAMCGGVGREELAEYLRDISGMNEAEHVVLSHFGTRAFLIKTSATLERVDKALRAIEYSHETKRSPVVLETCNHIRQGIDKLRENSIFAELELLRDYYEGKLRFPTEADDKNFLALTGEYGSDAASRLGLDKSASLANIAEAALALRRRWAEISTDMVQSHAVNEAAQTMLKEIDTLYSHIEMLLAY